MMAVSFERSGRLYYLDPGPYMPAVGDKVLVPTDAGPEVAECIWAPQYVDDEITGLPVCAGLATEEHMSRDEANRARRAEGRVAARRLVREHELPMKVVAVDYLDSPDVFTIYFSAPRRVDFRALVRDLAGRLHARVELRQIGPRDEARLQGGIGPCGRDLCCATFLKDFEPVSVRMAKDQDLASAVPEVPGGGAAARVDRGVARGTGHGGRPQRPRRQRGGEAGRGRAALCVPEGQRVRVQAGLRGQVRSAVAPQPQ